MILCLFYYTLSDKYECMNKKPFYITTTLPYVNAEPHVGFALEIIRADSIARWKKAQGYDVFFNTGTDEHGQKLFESAQKSGKKVKEYVDEYALKFKDLLQVLGISSDIHFIRTTDTHHEKAAQEFWKRVSDNGFIYKKNYKTKYCVGCELEKKDSDLVDGKCPLHPNRDLEIREEENYFFKFSQCGDALLAYYDAHPHFVVPQFRLNEMREFIKRGLEDFSISRLASKMSWGIPVPGDTDHVMYVWFDALVNYISTLGWPEDTKTFNHFWKEGTPTQYCGKDNTRFQAVMWQAMLLAAKLPFTHTVVVNGFVTGDGGVKMSKSLGNVINPCDVVREYGSEALRYFVTREVSSFEDSPFTMDRFKASYNSGLANGIGNMVSRVMKMASLHVVAPVTMSQDMPREYVEAMNAFDLHSAMEQVMSLVARVDATIQEKAPFKLVKTDKEKAQEIITSLCRDVYTIGLMLEPIMPETSEKIRTVVKGNSMPSEPLFLRKE